MPGANQTRAAPASQEAGEPTGGWSDAARNSLGSTLAHRARHGLDRIDFLEAAQGGGEQQFIYLSTAIPVRLIYRNVFIDKDGKLAFRTYPYGWDGPIAKALGFADRADTKLRSDETDIAP
ncbi:hypothetical protein [Sphingobium herbicidovorans]|nr:hypothetical protein [Sphingobium herbicidovorans]